MSFFEASLWNWGSALAGMSGTTTPLTPDFLAVWKKRSAPIARIGLEYVRRTSGRSCWAENSPAIDRIFLGVMPARKDLWLEAWITGPSAIGSENGMPISTISAPPSTSAEALVWNSSGIGSPPVKYAIRAPSLRDRSSSNLEAIGCSLWEVSCNDLDIFVASS